MGIQSFTPSGGGGTPGFDYIASIRMETYNRSWTQAGAAGNYILTSNNLSNGYAYFVGATTTGTPLGQVVNLTEPFTRIDIVGPQGDYISLQKAAVKTTTLFANPLSGFSSFPSVIRSSGNFVLPNNALPLVNLLIAGGGGGGGNGGHGGGGGGGGSVVKLTAYQAVGTTSIVIGGGGGGNGQGGVTYFGNVYSYGGGGGGQHGGSASTHDGVYGNGGGAGGWSNTKTGAAGKTMTSAQFGVKGSPVSHGGHAGGNASPGGDIHYSRGGGGGGATSAGSSSIGQDTGGVGGSAHVDTTHGTGTTSFGAGGAGRSHYNQGSMGSHSGTQHAHGGNGGSSNHGGPDGGDSGAVIVRYYIP